VKIFGNPNEYEGRRNLVVFDIRAVTDFNEVTYHILDSQLTVLQNTKGPLKKSSGQAGMSAGISSPVRGVPSCKLISKLLRYFPHLYPDSCPDNPSGASSSYRQQATPSAQMGNMSINHGGPKKDMSLGTVKLVSIIVTAPNL
jgi:hypothetical protein